jgi:hypothetical protein
MKPTASRFPFLLSALVTAGAGFGLLMQRDAPPRPSDSAAQARTSRARYVDSRQEVAHPADLVATSLSFGLGWLQRHQHAEGLWSARSFTQRCEGKVCLGRGSDEHEVGVTALATLAILESGRARPKFEDTVRRALAWLASRQDESGCFGPRAGKSVYGHSLATLAFARATALIDAETCRGPAARGVRFLETARNPGLAWRYGVRDGQNDTSVTAWAAAALLAASAPEVGIRVDPYALEGVRRWLAEATDERTRETSYMRRGAGSSSVHGVNDHYQKNEGLTAAALWLRLRTGQDRRQPEIAEAAKRLVWNLPVWNEEGTSVDYTAWFSGTRALAAYGDPEVWNVWGERVLRILAAHQRRYNEGCLSGSWDPADKWGAEGGRVYATSMNLLTLGILNSMPKPALPITAR